MLSEKARKQLQMFLNTLEKETGISPQKSQFYFHRGDQETADNLRALGFEMESNDEETTFWANYEETVNNFDFKITYFYIPEEQVKKCDICEEELVNTFSYPYIENMCSRCYDEMAAEKHHEKSEFLRSVL